MSFPPRFFLYIPSRKSYSAYVLMAAAQVEGAWNLTQVGPEANNLYTIEIQNLALGAPQYNAEGMVVMRSTEGLLLKKHIRSHPNVKVTGPHPDTSPFLVYSIAAQHTVFGSTKLKHNVLFSIIEHPPSLIIPPLPQISPSPSPSSPPFPSPSPPPQPKKNISVANLTPFVAKQLFDLAIMRKEQCPVTMEDFSQGNTAIMPCGHLFMVFALEESFKAEPNKCPWCRQKGSPTFV